MTSLWHALPTVSPFTLGWLMLSLGAFLAGLARFLEVFRPRR